jgi:hypothetical protein
MYSVAAAVRVMCAACAMCGKEEEAPHSRRRRKLVVALQALQQPLLLVLFAATLAHPERQQRAHVYLSK